MKLEKRNLYPKGWAKLFLYIETKRESEDSPNGEVTATVTFEDIHGRNM